MGKELLEIKEHSIFHSYGLLVPLILSSIILLTHETPDGKNAYNKSSHYRKSEGVPCTRLTEKEDKPKCP